MKNFRNLLADPTSYWHDNSPEAQGQGVDIHIVGTSVARVEELVDKNTLVSRVMDGKGYGPFNDPLDGQPVRSLGTRLAVCAAGNVHGIARKARIRPYRVTDKIVPPTRWRPLSFDPKFVTEALSEIKRHDLKRRMAFNQQDAYRGSVVLLPLMVDYSPQLQEAVQSIINSGIPIVTSAGNANTERIMNRLCDRNVYPKGIFCES